MRNYWIFVLFVALSPVLPLALCVLVGGSCHLFGTGLIFSCSQGGGIGDNHSVEAVGCVLGVLGWVFSLPAAFLLSIVGLIIHFGKRGKGA